MTQYSEAQTAGEPVIWQIFDVFDGQWKNEAKDMIEVRREQGFPVRPLYAAPCTAPVEGETVAAALRIALDHIEHMSTWIANQKAGYSFESLGEDMPSMRAALDRSPSHG